MYELNVAWVYVECPLDDGGVQFGSTVSTFQHFEEDHNAPILYHSFHLATCAYSCHSARWTRVFASVSTSPDSVRFARHVDTHTRHERGGIRGPKNENHRRSRVSCPLHELSRRAHLSRGVQTDLDLDTIGDAETADVIPELLADYAADCNDWTALASEHWRQGRLDRAEELIRKGIECQLVSS